MNKLQQPTFKTPFYILMLTLAPLLLMSKTAASALFLGLVSYVVLVVSAFINQAIGQRVPEHCRLLLVVLVASSLTTLIHLLLLTFKSDAAIALNLLLPLIAANALLLWPFVSKDAVSVKQQHKTILVFVLTLFILATVREVLATGAIFNDIALYFGETSKALQIRFFDDGLLLAQLAPGAFIILALLLALFNHLSANKQASSVELIDTSERRARVTGRIA